jgi:hypothetical protein
MGGDMTMRAWPIALLGIALGAGCYSGVGDLDGQAEGGGPGADGADDAADGAADDGSEGGADDDGGDDDGAAAGCESGPSVGAAPLRRLTRFEYDNTIRDLLGDDTRPAESSFSPDEVVGGYASNAVAPISQTQLDQYAAAAEDLAEAFVTDGIDAWIACPLSDSTCVGDFVADFGRRAFRRPLLDVELAEYVALYESGKTEWGAQTGVQLVVQAMLMSPHFLYHVEVLPPGAAETDVVELAPFELASRLSYFVWASAPDDALLDAAESGDILTPTGLEAEVRRLLDDDRAADAIASFHEQWMHLGGLGDLVKDAELFPQWSPELAASMRQETLAFADEVIRNGDGSLATLMTAAWTIGDARVAELYGATAPTEPLGQIELPPGERAGILTHAGFLATNAHASETSWVYRGKFVRENLLCQPLPAPPPGVEVNAALDLGRLDDPECSGCHLLMDPIGIGFDGYDALGIRIDDGPGGEVLGVPEIGQFDTAVQLAGALAESAIVHDCVATQWFRFASRRAETPADECAVDAIQASFAESGQDVRELVVAVALSDAFRYRTSAAGE